MPVAHSVMYSQKVRSSCSLIVIKVKPLDNLSQNEPQAKLPSYLHYTTLLSSLIPISADYPLTGHCRLSLWLVDPAVLLLLHTWLKFLLLCQLSALFTPRLSITIRSTGKTAWLFILLYHSISFEYCYPMYVGLLAQLSIMCYLPCITVTNVLLFTICLVPGTIGFNWCSYGFP